MQLRLGNHFVVPALEDAVRGMLVGETKSFNLAPADAQGVASLVVILRAESQKLAPPSCTPTQSTNTYAMHHHLSPSQHTEPHFATTSMAHHDIDHHGCCGVQRAIQHPDLLSIINKILDVTVTLLHIEAASTCSKEHWELSPEEKAALILLIKEEGNVCFRAADFETSLDKYTTALSFIDVVLQSEHSKNVLPQAMRDRARTEKIPCLLNYCAVQLHRKVVYYFLF